MKVAKIRARNAMPVARSAYVVMEPEDFRKGTIDDYYVKEYLLRSDGTVLFRTSGWFDGRPTDGKWKVARLFGRVQDAARFRQMVEAMANHTHGVIRIGHRLVVHATGEEKAAHSLTRELRDWLQGR